MREIRKHSIDRSELHEELIPNRPPENPDETKESTVKQAEKSVLPGMSAKKEVLEDIPPVQTDLSTDKIKKKQRTGKGKVVLILVAAVVLLAVTCFKIYIDNDYKPLRSHEEYQELTDIEIEFSDNVIALEDLDQAGDVKTTGFIFYGDHRVQRESYLPLMIALSDLGYSVYLPTTFGNIPILNLEGAEYVSRTYTHVKNWYIVAHGKACPVAAKYASSHASKLRGLIFLGGYSKTDLTDTNLRLLSITGTNDTVLDTERFLSAQANDPKDTIYYEINGGNHTGFTDTHLIRKDTEAAIPADEQIRLTVSAIEAFITSGSGS